MDDDLLHVGDFTFKSRLFAGTGRHRSNEQLAASLEASGAEVVTVAIRRLNLDNPSEPTILDVIDPGRYTVLPNTAGCKTVEEALMTARLTPSICCPTRSARWKRPRSWLPTDSPSCLTFTPIRCWRSTSRKSAAPR